MADPVALGDDGKVSRHEPSARRAESKAAVAAAMPRSNSARLGAVRSAALRVTACPERLVKGGPRSVPWRNGCTWPA